MIIRHGDLLLVRCGELPNKPKSARRTRHVLLEGEATGHAHVLLAPAYRKDDKITVLEPGFLVHEEHRKVAVKPGVYEIRRQREWDVQWKVPRPVSD